MRRAGKGLQIRGRRSEVGGQRPEDRRSLGTKSQMSGHRLPGSKGKKCQDMGNQGFLLVDSAQ